MPSHHHNQLRVFGTTTSPTLYGEGISSGSLSSNFCNQRNLRCDNDSLGHKEYCLWIDVS
eukprot:m.100133 g.100133  ORF g.100133 m.100133 type:complete len:60 (+) comp12547_c0_seq26:974-1153(+)